MVYKVLVIRDANAEGRRRLSLSDGPTRRGQLNQPLRGRQGAGMFSET